MNSQQLIAELETERTRIDHAISALRGNVRTSNRTHNVVGTGKRHLSAAAKRTISQAMKKRWAERKKNGLKVVARNIARKAA
ncbi:MAG TPA: hypothetical protein VGN44_05690 [Candidatus Angelobacter sp.]|jgi:hypothetical protein